MEGQSDSGRTWPSVVAICVAVAVVYWFIDSRSTLWDRDEPRFSRATAEMVASGNYLYPTFNDRLRPDKPILIYWLMSVPMRVLGPTSLACRFFSSVGIAVTCGFTFLIARRFLGVQAGLWSMAILASTLLILVEGTAATSDGILLPCMVAVMALFGQGLTSGWRWYHVPATGLALGLGLLAKGPVALLPVMVILITLWLLRRNEVRVGSYLGPLGGAAVMGCLLFVVWAIPANNATGGEFLRLGIGHHVLARASRPLESHGGRFLLYLPYYPLIIIACFFPWTLHLPGSISAVLHRRVGSDHFREVFLAWVVSIVVLMTLIATKLPHYVLFTWPAMALAVGGTLAAAAQGKLEDIDRRWLRGGIYFFGPVAGIGVLGFLAAPFWLHLRGALVPFWGVAVVLLAMSLLALRQQLRDRPRASAITLLVGMAILLLPVTLGIMPALEEVKISPVLAEAIRQRTTADVPVATFDYDEPTLYYYVARRVESLGSEKAIVQWARQPQPGVLVVTDATRTQLESRHGSLGLTEIAAAEGVNFAKGTKLRVVALLRQAASPAVEGGNP
ncbi:MAG: glycosyltransferase family 39 protein [Planctomycetes bacterium]|jgi:4-amino-4-deoxy-L-arabinose transferase-like glycosyltransferase|nr:glycosyltransferase family 39 protein [Planctomycetota bacterium]